MTGQAPLPLVVEVIPAHANTCVESDAMSFLSYVIKTRSGSRKY